MKRLAIIRHAKTEQFGYERDFARELTDRGINDVAKIIEDLKDWKVKPDRIISSPARRAVHTAQLFAQGFDYPVDKIIQIEGLYFEFTTKNFVELVQSTDIHIETLFVIGHNPFMHYVAQNMSIDYDGHMPTSSTVVLDFDVDSWADVEARTGLLFLHLYPKIYK